MGRERGRERERGERERGGREREGEREREKEREREREKGGGGEWGREKTEAEGRHTTLSLPCVLEITIVVGWLLNVPATCECISGKDLLRQFYVLPH